MKKQIYQVMLKNIISDIYRSIFKNSIIERYFNQFYYNMIKTKTKVETLKTILQTKYKKGERRIY